MSQFVRRVEQLNAYIAQMPCFFYSPNVNAGTKPKNVPFMEVELEARAAYVPYPVAGPVQSKQERYDADGHVLASHFLGGD